jgi:hypothetical protein
MSRIQEIRERIAKLKQEEKTNPEKKKKWVFLKRKYRKPWYLRYEVDPWDVPGARG